MQLSQEKLEILSHDGSILVIANPGTGKTTLLAHKFVSLLQNGTKPEEILCLTFTKKARKEMETKIHKQIKADGLKMDHSKLNIHTFHSYALDHLGDEDVISSNLLRYSIYRHIREHDMLNYYDAYLLGKIVPKMENLIRYMKSFGVMPDSIDLETVKQFISETDKFTKDELDAFAGQFLEIFRNYEAVKNTRGIDYADMLLEFLALNRIPKFKHVLIDELQDVNSIEAEIAIKSADCFFAVGDRKQAIFGFQGGSIINFVMFSKARSFVLTENFRSTNNILGYAREQFSKKNSSVEYSEELRNLRNVEAGEGPKPKVYEVDKSDKLGTVCGLVAGLKPKNKQIAIIARTNLQILNISKSLDACGIEHSSTYFQASAEAKDHIITFIRGIISKDLRDMKSSLFTPFSPIALQDAFELSQQRIDDPEAFLEKCPSLRVLRESVRNIEDVSSLFDRIILPAAVTHGREYFLAAVSVNAAFREAIGLIEDKTIEALVAYLKSSDMAAAESQSSKEVVVTSVHKAKGREFDIVIYLPSKPKSDENFQDLVVEAILQSKDINAKEELDEESLRIDFVAFTRAREELHIITEIPKDYSNSFSESGTIESLASGQESYSERAMQAYTMFLNGETEKARQLLDSEKSWLSSHVRDFFANLNHVSYSSLQSNAYDYMVRQVIGLKDYSPATDLGSQVHSAIEAMLRGEKFSMDEKAEPFVRNAERMIVEIKREYPDLVETELELKVPLSQIIGGDSGLEFKGYIDAVFRNGNNYLIVDWKTSRTQSSEHKQQLAAYRKAYSLLKGIPEDSIKVAVCYIGLRPAINTGEVSSVLDNRQPAKSALGTFSKKALKVVGWKNDVDIFFKELAECNEGSHLWRSLIEQYGRER